MKHLARRTVLASSALILADQAEAQETTLRGEVVDITHGARCAIRRSATRRSETANIGSRLHVGDEVRLQNPRGFSVTLLIMGAFQVELTNDHNTFVVPNEPTLELVLGDWLRILQEIQEVFTRTRDREPVQTMSRAEVDHTIPGWGLVVGASGYIDTGRTAFTTWVMAAPSENQVFQSANVYLVTRGSRIPAGQVLGDVDVYTIASDARIQSGILTAPSEVTGTARRPEQGLGGVDLPFIERARPFTYYVNEGIDAYNVRVVNVSPRRLPTPPWNQSGDNPVEPLSYAIWLATTADPEWGLEGLARLRALTQNRSVPTEISDSLKRLFEEKDGE